MLAASDAAVGGWICFGLGGLMFLVGLVLGAYIGWKEAVGATREKVEAKVDLAVKKVSDLTARAVDAANTDGKDAAAATAATATGGSTTAALKEVEELLKTLPERLRFAGFLILIGALLMSVATVQFGGHSIF